MIRDEQMAAALASADRQLTLVQSALHQAIGQARELLRHHDETKAWALLAQDIKQQLDCTTGRPYFAAEMAAAAAIQLAKHT